MKYLLCAVLFLGGLETLLAEPTSPHSFKSENPERAPLWVESAPLILAQNEMDTFDPFIDYGEFQDNVAEEESINFFKNGRSLSVLLFGGYEAITMNMRYIYGDNPFLLGAGIGFFLDLRFAIQINGTFSSEHYNSLIGTLSPFSHYGLNLKYYFNRQYVNKDKDFFNPYLIFGPFWLNIKSQFPKTENQTLNQPISPPPNNPQVDPNASPIPTAQQGGIEAEDKRALIAYNGAGIKLGFGLEFALIKQSFIGLEVSYLYTVLEFENQDLTTLDLPPPAQVPSNQSWFDRLRFPKRPNLEGIRYFGDLVNAVAVVGINF